MNTSKIVFAVAAAFCYCAGGCVSPVGKDGRLRHENFVVVVSNLDWLEIEYLPSADPVAALTRFPVRVSVAGTGEVSCETGRSPRIWNSRSLDVENPYWNEIISDSVHLDKTEIFNVLQRFVDEGAVVTRQPKKPPSQLPAVIVRGNISGKKIRLYTDNIHIVGLVGEIIGNFPLITRKN